MKKEPDLSGRNIIFLNSGGKKKKFTLERAKKLGVNIILVNKKLDCGKNIVGSFIEADTYNHSEVIEKLKSFLKQNPDTTFDGAITFWEDDVPLLARVCEEFSLTGNTYKTAINTRNKYEMRKRLKETGLGCPEFHLVKTHRDLKKAIEEIGFPAVMKPVWGADSEFVILARDEIEAKNTLNYFFKNCNEQFNPIFKYNDSSFLYEEYMDGTEVSVEGFSQYGIPHVIGIHEKQAVKPPYFIEYGDIIPARIDPKVQEEVVKLAESSMIALGVTNSLSHIEIKTTANGPKIVEVASRMGGDYIYDDIKEIWGVDMVELGIKIATNQTVKPHRKDPKGCIMGRYFIPKSSGVITKIQNAKEARLLKNVIQVAINKNVGDAILVPPEGFENAGWAVVKGRTHQEGEILLNKIMETVEINVTKFHKDSSLGKTSSSLDNASIVRNQILRASKMVKIRSVNLNAVKKLHIGLLTNDITGGEEIKNALSSLGYSINLFDISELPFPIKKIQDANLDFVINLTEAKSGSTMMKAYAADFLDMMQIPYTGSNAGTLSLATDKVKVKKLLEYHSIPTPEWDYIESLDEEINDDLCYPLIVKPANSDNHFGINNNSIVTNKRELKKQLKIMIEKLQKPALIEEYIEGDEVDVSIIGNSEDAEVLPLIRSIFDKVPKGYWHIYSSEIYEIEHKKALDLIRIEKPARIPQKLDTLISEMALDIFNIFDCRDYTKIEMRIDKNGNPFVLELNPNPSIRRHDFLPLAAKLAGYNYEEFLEEIILTAVQRHKDHPPFYHLQYE